MNFEDFYQKYRRNLFIYVFGKVENKEIAEDLTAETFCRMFKNWKKLEERNEEGMISCVYVVARNLVIDHYKRKKAVSLKYEPISEYEEIMQDIIKEENKRVLHKAIQNLSKDKQELLEFRFGQELSFAQISKVIRKNEPACKMKLYRTLKELKNNLPKL